MLGAITCKKINIIHHITNDAIFQDNNTYHIDCLQQHQVEQEQNISSTITTNPLNMLLPLTSISNNTQITEMEMDEPATPLLTSSTKQLSSEQTKSKNKQSNNQNLTNIKPKSNL